MSNICGAVEGCEVGGSIRMDRKGKGGRQRRENEDGNKAEEGNVLD